MTSEQAKKTQIMIEFIDNPNPKRSHYDCFANTVFHRPIPIFNLFFDYNTRHETPHTLNQNKKQIQSKTTLATLS